MVLKVRSQNNVWLLEGPFSDRNVTEAISEVGSRDAFCHKSKNRREGISKALCAWPKVQRITRKTKTMSGLR